MLMCFDPLPAVDLGMDTFLNPGSMSPESGLKRLNGRLLSDSVANPERFMWNPKSGQERIHGRGSFFLFTLRQGAERLLFETL